MESLIDSFHINIGILIAQAVNFGVVFIVLYLFALKPLAKLMRERTSKIEKGLTDAKDNAEKLAKTQEEYKKTIVEARKEAQELVVQAKKDAEVKRAEMIEKAKSEVGALLETGKKQLVSEKDKMIGEARKEISSVIIEAMRKIAGEVVSDKVDEKLVEKSLVELRSDLVT